MPYAALACIAAGVVPLADSALGETPDGLIHLHRTGALSAALRQGVLYPRYLPEFAFGYGYPVFHYYAPLSYYPAALMHAAGMALQPAALAGLALFHTMSAVAMFLFLRVWCAPIIAFCGAAFWALAPYGLYNLNVRGALPEFAAAAWIPVIALAAAKLFSLPSTANPRGQAATARERAMYAVLLATSCAGLVLTHNLTAMLAALTLGGIGVAAVLVGAGRHLPWPRRDERGGDSVIPPRLGFVASFSLLGAGLAAFYFLPALMELAWVGLGQGAGHNGYLRHLAGLPDLFSRAFPYAYPAAAVSVVPVPGAALIAGSGTVLLLVAGRDRSLRTAAAISLLITIVALLMMTTLSTPAWNLSAPILGKLQFPWRWQSMVAFGVAWGAGLVLEWIRTLVPPKAVSILYGLIAALVAGYAYMAIAGLPRGMDPAASERLTVDSMWQWDADQGQVGLTWTGEFLPQWVSEQRWAIGRPPPAATDVGNREPSVGVIESVRDRVDVVRPVRSGYLDTVYEAVLSAPSRLVFHTFYFPAWRVTVDGRRVESAPASELGLLSADVPAGSHELGVVWRPTPWVVAGWTVSGAAWLALLLYLLWVRPQRKAMVYAWLAVGAMPLLAWLMPARITAPAAIGADYGSVRLEASALALSASGSAVDVDLTWLIVDPEEPMTAFVHVVSAEGAMVAQYDGPLAGEYTPFERWLPGLVVTRRHAVPLPPALLPGTYSVWGGVYPSQSTGGALRPEFNSERGPLPPIDEHHRILLGTFEIRG